MAGPSKASGTPEFMTSETVAQLLAGLLELGVARYREQASERGEDRLAEATLACGTRGALALRSLHEVA